MSTGSFVGYSGVMVATGWSLTCLYFFFPSFPLDSVTIRYFWNHDCYCVVLTMVAPSARKGQLQHLIILCSASPSGPLRVCTLSNTRPSNWWYPPSDTMNSFSPLVISCPAHPQAFVFCASIHYYDVVSLVFLVYLEQNHIVWMRLGRDLFYFLLIQLLWLCILFHLLLRDVTKVWSSIVVTCFSMVKMRLTGYEASKFLLEFEWFVSWI